MADEKHSWRRGKRLYIAVTAAMGCFFGAESAETSDAVALEKAYGVFQQEALQQDPDYQARKRQYRWLGGDSNGVEIHLSRGYLNPVFSP